MKFLQITRAPEGLTSYAKVNRARPVQTLITVVEALLSLVGVAVLILWAWQGSFGEAGAMVDKSIACAWGWAAGLIK
ncbi:hypothetical protein ABI_05980 [Asticcacaulis biprosthecium C19]|uniref:Uncharacterized protein n=1 Tax=Asticcacaulis biprosthecium C19 TaxID=715226 RepID=F4QKL3_9CAUL|nr:hypothetical protein [Asticcacaulis biprosthecium]EGF92165.1 hypothetical protein ABI_05980 [Asticcacaulis biprosthecium C19]